MKSIVLAIVSAAAAACCAKVVTWSQPDAALASDGAYSVKVNGRPVDVVGIPKPSHCLKGDNAHPYYAAFFDADEEVTVEVRGDVPLRWAWILPKRMGVRKTVKDDSTIVFKAKPPFNLVVEPQKRHRALVLSANLPETDAPKQGDPGVVYFGPGRHRLDRPLSVTTNQTLYLAPGALVEGAVWVHGDNVKVRGRGIVSGAPWAWCKGPAGWMFAVGGKNVSIKDVVIMSGWTWTLVLDRCEDALVENVKILNGRVLNDDGIDVCHSRRVTIRNSFVRSQDDCVAAKFWCEDLLVENCTFWTDVANIIRVGYECDGPAFPFRRHVYRNIDVLHQAIMNDKDPDDYWSENTIAIQPSNNVVFEDMLFDDFRFDMPQVQDLFLCLRTPICHYGKEHHKEGGHARNIRFRNIHFPAKRPLGAYGIWLHSVDPDHRVEDVSFENVDNLPVPIGVRGDVRNVRGLNIPEECRK